MFDEEAVGDAAAEVYGEFLDEVGGHRQVVGVSEAGDAEPGSDAADAADVGLDELEGAALEKVEELLELVFAFAGGQGGRDGSA